MRSGVIKIFICIPAGEGVYAAYVIVTAGSSHAYSKDRTLAPISPFVHLLLAIPLLSTR